MLKYCGLKTRLLSTVVLTLSVLAAGFGWGSFKQKEFLLQEKIGILRGISTLTLNMVDHLIKSDDRGPMFAVSIAKNLSMAKRISNDEMDLSIYENGALIATTSSSDMPLQIETDLVDTETVSVSSDAITIRRNNEGIILDIVSYPVKLRELNEQLRLTLGITILSSGIVAILSTLMIGLWIRKRAQDVGMSLSAYMGGNFNIRAKTHPRDEMGTLASAINMTGDGLKDYLEMQKVAAHDEVIRKFTDEAGGGQMKVCLDIETQIPEEFVMTSYLRFMEGLGGDFLVGRGRWLIVGDIEGKGPPAAVPSIIAARSFMGTREAYKDERWLIYLNEALQNQKRAACTFLRFPEEAEGNIEIINLGGPDVLVRTINGDLLRFASTGEPIPHRTPPKWEGYVTVPLKDIEWLCTTSDGATVSKDFDFPLELFSFIDTQESAESIGCYLVANFTVDDDLSIILLKRKH